MKIISSTSGYAHKVVRARLGPEDEGRTNDELITAADNGGDYGGPVRHFGGFVIRSGDIVEIKVYTD